MPDSTSALSILDLDDSALEQLAEQLEGQGAPDAATLVQAMREFTTTTSDHLEDLPAQTLDMRRSHLTVLVALVDDMRARLAEIFRAIDLDGRLPDADMLDPVYDGLDGAGEAMTGIVGTLLNPHQ